MNGDRPVTQAQLVAELKATRAELRQEMGEMRAELRQEIAGVRTELVGAIHHVVETFGARFDQMHDDMVAMRRDMATMHADLSRQIAGAARAAAEENRREIGIVDDKYRDLPGRVAVLERELDEHRRDTGLHPRRRR
jgi:hypothetical protein